MWWFLRKLKVELPYNPAIHFWNIYPKKMKQLIRRDTCTLVFTVASFIAAKMWKQTKCPQIDEWIKDVTILRTHIYRNCT